MIDIFENYYDKIEKQSLNEGHTIHNYKGYFIEVDDDDLEQYGKATYCIYDNPNWRDANPIKVLFDCKDEYNAKDYIDKFLIK